MARTTGRSGFKMRSGNTPLRHKEGGVDKKTLKSEISRFFSDLGLKRQTPDPGARGDYMARKYGTGKYRASGEESEKAYKGGESKFQYDRRMRALENRKDREEIKVVTPEIIESEAPEEKDYYRAREDDPGDAFNHNALDNPDNPTRIYDARIHDWVDYTGELLPGLPTGPSASGFKMKSSPAKIYSKAKGKRTEY